MQPTLQPGDRVLIQPVNRLNGVLEGTIVVALHPRRSGLRLIKRLRSMDSRGLWLLGDNPNASTDSRQLGFIPRDLLIGAVVSRIQIGESEQGS